MTNKNTTIVCEKHSKQLAQEVQNNGKSVKVALPDDEGPSEFLWAEKTGTPGVYKLDNIPMLVPGYSLGDLVRAKKTSAGLVVTKTVKRSGNLTFGVMFKSKAIEKTMLHILNKTEGASVEGFSKNHWSVSLPKEEWVATMFLSLLHKTKRADVFSLSHTLHMETLADEEINPKKRDEFVSLFERMLPKAPKASKAAQVAKAA
jgi:hypothetical protein